MIPVGRGGGQGKGPAANVALRTCVVQNFVIIVFQMHRRKCIYVGQRGMDQNAGLGFTRSVRVI